VRSDVHGLRDGLGVAVGSFGWTRKFRNLRSGEASYETSAAANSCADSGESSCDNSREHAARFAESEAVIAAEPKFRAARNE
jgi:hypothetical protein